MRRLGLLLLVVTASLWAQEQDGPKLLGTTAGRVWSWQGGEKTWLTPEGQNLVLGGVTATSVWGWNQEGGQARFFRAELPAEGKDEAPQLQPVWDPLTTLAPERADWRGQRRLLVWGTAGSPRYEVWDGATLVAARAWDDGRTVYALALGPESGWVLAGRTTQGRPWLEVNGADVAPPEGWRGRLTVAAWMISDDAPAVPVAAGWGATDGSLPQPLFWGADGWTVPPPAETPVAVYPVLGSAGEQGLLLAGWQADAGTGALRPWFWMGEDAIVPGGAADGQPVAATWGGKGGAFLVVRHQASPWYTKEDGKESVPLEGLDADDTVVAVATASPSEQ